MKYANLINKYLKINKIIHNKYLKKNGLNMKRQKNYKKL